VAERSRIAPFDNQREHARAPPGRSNLANQGFAVMAQLNVENSVTASAAALIDSRSAATAAVQELTKAYQELAARNAGHLTSALQALAAVKSPAEFMEVQQRLLKDAVQAAVSDGQNIAHLTTAVFTAAFEPVKQQIDAVQKTVRH
jgi:hypothetical protein